jgi:hypothetical protein
MSKFKTVITAKAELVEPEGGQKALANRISTKHGIQLPPQVDILCVRSCLVTAGMKSGINENDDIFVKEEAWAARHTPLIKPANWQHNDKDILGVTYSVEARDLDGNLLDMSSDEVPDCEFEFWTEDAIFKLIHPERSAEIQARAEAGTLYVSMEAWFDDYSYGQYDTDGICKIIAREQNTSFLDSHLRANRGVGSYEGKRLGRVLRGITYGGKGFVDKPANKRSIISDVYDSSAHVDVQENQIAALFSKLMERMESDEKSQDIKEETLMNAQAKNEEQDLSQAISDGIAASEAAKAEAAAKEALKATASELEAKVQELESQTSELSDTNQKQTEETEMLNKQLTDFNEAVDSLVKGAAAGSVPAEIAAIDSATDGDGAFRAKLAWVEKSMASLQERAARADELEAELAKAGEVVRENEVRREMAGLPEDTINALVAKASSLDDVEYHDWLSEKKLLIVDVATAAFPDFGKDKEKGKDKDKDKEKMKDKKETKKETASAFEALLLSRLNTTGNEETSFINHPGGADITSGVGANALRNPKDRLVKGSADEDLTDALNDVQADGNVDLAGASQNDTVELDKVQSAFKAMAKIITSGQEDKSSDKSEKPDFDPVK